MSSVAVCARALDIPAEVRSDSAGGVGVLAGHFAVFNQWTEIRSAWEGNFVERVAPTAFDRAFSGDVARFRVLYDHGKDPSVGNKPLGAIRSLGPDDIGAAYEVDLFDASYVRDLIPALKAGQMGASFRFSVPKNGDQWNNKPDPSDYNPGRLPERTITDLDLYEFGPVTFPAYAGATAGMRSTTDEWVDRLLNDPRFAARFRDRVGPNVHDRLVHDLTDGERGGDPESADGAEGDGTTGRTASGDADGSNGDLIRLPWPLLAARLKLARS